MGRTALGFSAAPSETLLLLPPFASPAWELPAQLAPGDAFLAIPQLLRSISGSHRTKGKVSHSVIYSLLLPKWARGFYLLYCPYDDVKDDETLTYYNKKDYKRTYTNINTSVTTIYV